MKRKSTLWPKRKAKPRPGPVPPPEGRIRIYVNLPKSLMPFVDSLPGRSASAKIVNALAHMYDRDNGQGAAAIALAPLLKQRESQSSR